MGLGKFLLILTLIIVVLLAVVIWYYPSSVDFRTENPFWNGLKTFTNQFKASLVSSLDSLPSTPKETTLVLIPQLEFTEPEVESLQDYLSLGGTVIILDDYGYGNYILEHLEIDIRFTQQPLLDPLFNYKNKSFPKIIDFTPVSVTEGVDSIVLNHATSLSGVSEDEILARSSRFSFLDLDNNSIWNEGDPRGPLPVAAATQVNEGYLVLVSDPSILINSMEEMNNNHSFIGNIIEIQGPSPEILVDQSHIPEASLDDAKATLKTIRNRLSSPLGISILVVAALIVVLSPIWLKNKRLTPTR